MNIPLERFEVAARAFCVACGEDPDKSVPAPSPTRGGMLLTVHCTHPLWMSVAAEMQRIKNRMLMTNLVDDLVDSTKQKY